MRTYLLLHCLLAVFLCRPFAVECKEKKESYLILDVPSEDCTGFFATFSAVLSMLDVYQNGDYAGLKVNLHNHLYLDEEKGPNWWDYFFKPIKLGNEKAAPLYISSVEDRMYHVGRGFQLSRNRAYKLIKKHVLLKPEIKKELNTFVHEHFKGHFMIGIHHRGTDKKMEVPLVPYAKTLDTLHQLILELPKKKRKKLKIYVATDEQAFLTTMLATYPSLVVHGDFKRSTTSQSLHSTTDLYASNYEKGKEALLECLLLSKCNTLIYPSASSLSHAALKFNPKLKAIPLD